MLDGVAAAQAADRVLPGAGATPGRDGQGLPPPPARTGHGARLTAAKGRATRSWYGAPHQTRPPSGTSRVARSTSQSHQHHQHRRPGQFTLIMRIGLLPTPWNRGSTAFERGGFNWWLQRFPDVEVVVGVVLRGRPE